MGKKKRKRRTKTIPLAPILGFIGGITMGTSSNPSGLITYVQNQQWEPALNVVVTNMTGIIRQTGKFDFNEAHALHGLIAGGIIHKVMTWLGVNRTFQNLPAPLNKLRI